MPVDNLVLLDDQLELADSLLDAADKTPFITVFFLNRRDSGFCDECRGKRKPESLIQHIVTGADKSTSVITISYICRRCART